MQETLDDFNNFPKEGRLLGIDWGGKRIGLALSTPERDFCFAKDGQLMPTLAEEKLAGIVIGLPLRLNGTESETTKKVRAFAADLATKTDLPIVLFDESLTSFEASENGAKDLDSESARIMLENAIAVMRRQLQ